MSPSANPSPAEATTGRSALRASVGSILLDAGPPLLIFFVLRSIGVADVLAYTAGSIVPLVRLIADRLRGRDFNVVSGLIVVFLAVSVVLAATTGDARAVIARGGWIYGALALAALISVPTRGPLMLLLARYFVARGRPETLDRFNQNFTYNPGLRAMRAVTTVWGLAFVIVAVACVVCAYTLPVTVSATVTSLIEPIIALVLAAGTASYLRRAMSSATGKQAASDGAARPADSAAS